MLKAMSPNKPEFQLRAHQYPKWFSPELQHQLKCLQTFHTLWKKYKHSPTSHNLDRLNYAEDQFQLNIDSTKSNYDANLIYGFTNHNTSKSYGYIQSITKTKILSLYFILIHPLLQLMLIKLCFTMNIFILCTQILRLLYQI